eukprot:6333830-Amphidinium_carterae.1
MARFAHLEPQVVSDRDSQSGTQDDPPMTRMSRKRQRTPSPTPEELQLTGDGPTTLPFGAPPSEAMFAASSASVRKEQAAARSNRSNRPRSPAKKPREDTNEQPKGPQRQAPQPPQQAMGSAASGSTGIPPP